MAARGYTIVVADRAADGSTPFPSSIPNAESMMLSIDSLGSLQFYAHGEDSDSGSPIVEFYRNSDGTATMTHARGTWTFTGLNAGIEGADEDLAATLADGTCYHVEIWPGG